MQVNVCTFVWQRKIRIKREKERGRHIESKEDEDQKGKKENRNNKDVCVCNCEGERDKERVWERTKDRKYESVCMCVWAHVTAREWECYCDQNSLLHDCVYMHL